MRAPSLLLQCFPALSPNDKPSNCGSIVSERDLHLPSPAVEILPSKNAHPYKYAGEKLDMQGLNIFKGRLSVADMIGLSYSDIVPAKSDGSLKYWESSITLVNVLKNEIRDGQLSFRGKRILELSCGSGLAGIFACLKIFFLSYSRKLALARKLLVFFFFFPPMHLCYLISCSNLPLGASTVHFQDSNVESLRCRTVPNVLANLEQVRDRQSRPTESPVTPSPQLLDPDMHFYAGSWDELHTVLSLVQTDVLSATLSVNFSFSEDDLMDYYGSQDGSIASRDSCSQRSRKLSGSRSWERSSEVDQGEGGYDVILIFEVPFSSSSLQKLYALITKCLRSPYDILYLAAKKNLVGYNCGARQLRAVVDEEGVFGARLVAELADREVWKFFFK